MYYFKRGQMARHRPEGKDANFPRIKIRLPSDANTARSIFKTVPSNTLIYRNDLAERFSRRDCFAHLIKISGITTVFVVKGTLRRSLPTGGDRSLCFSSLQRVAPIRNTTRTIKFISRTLHWRANGNSWKIAVS